MPNFTTSRSAGFDANVKAIIQAGQVMLQEINNKRRKQEVESRKQSIHKGDLVILKDFSTGSKSSVKPFYKDQLYIVKKSNRFTGRLEVTMVDSDPRIRRKTILVHSRNVKKVRRNEKTENGEHKLEEQTDADTDDSDIDDSIDVEASDIEGVDGNEKEKDSAIISKYADGQVVDKNKDTGEEDTARSSYRRKLRQKPRVSYY